MKNYASGKIHGKYTEYHENGNLRSLGIYSKGKIVGEYFNYNRAGKLVETIFYKNGILSKVKKHYY